MPIEKKRLKRKSEKIMTGMDPMLQETIVALQPKSAGQDSGADIQAALAAIKAAGGGQIVLAAGVYELHSPQTASEWLWVDFSNCAIVCPDGIATLRVVGAPSNTAQDMLAFKANNDTGALEGFMLQNVFLDFSIPHSPNEQAHCLVLTGIGDQNWVRCIRISRCSGIAGSGDFIYCGSQSEDVEISDITADAARACVVIAGGAGELSTRRRFIIQRVERVPVDQAHNPDHANGPIVDLEPSGGRVNDRLLGVAIEDCRGPGAIHLEKAVGVVVRRCHITHLISGKVDGGVVEDCYMSGREGDGGDGRGYTIAHFHAPTRIKYRGCWLECPEGGAGIAYIRDYTQTEDPVYRLTFEVCTVRRFNPADQNLIRPDLWTDAGWLGCDIDSP